MKFNRLLAALAASLALAGAANADEIYTYVDTADNYPAGLSTGDNGGNGGFNPWTIVADSGYGYAGCGIWSTEHTAFTSYAGFESNAIGLIGKGAGASVTLSRPFTRPLTPGESFSIQMAVDWDCGSDPDSLKGFAVVAGGQDVVVVNHDPYPGPMSVNGSTDGDALQNYGTVPMTWIFTVIDATHLAVYGTARDGLSDPYAETLAVDNAFIDGFRLQSARQVDENEDHRQSYFNNFAIEALSEMPEPGAFENLSVSSVDNKYAINGATEDFTFVITRTGDTSADLTVALASDNISVLEPEASSVVIPAGEASVEVAATGTLPEGSGSSYFQAATLTASADGFVPASFGVKTPSFRMSVENNAYLFHDATPVNFWANIDDDGFIVDQSLIAIVGDDALALSGVDPIQWNAESDPTNAFYMAGSVAPAAVVGTSGAITVQFDGVDIMRWFFTVVPYDFDHIAGPSVIYPGSTADYQLFYLFGEETAVQLSCTPGLGSFDPAEITLSPDTLVDNFAFTAGPSTGTATIEVADYNGHSLSHDIEIAERPDYDSFVAYDSASFYPDLDFALDFPGKGSEGFLPWQVVQSATEGENFTGAYIGDIASLPGAILRDNAAIGLYANGTDGPTFEICRPFANSLAAGQRFHILWAPSSSDDGSSWVALVRTWEGQHYPRFKLYCSGGYIGCDIEGVTNGLSLWQASGNPVAIEVARAADGSGYTLSADDGAGNSWSCTVPEDTPYWGDELQGFVAGIWNSYANAALNEAYIAQDELPAPVAYIDGPYDVYAAGTLDYTLELDRLDADTAFNLSILDADENECTWAVLSRTSLVVSADTLVADFSVELSSITNGDFVIYATPADPSAGIGAADFYVAVGTPWLDLKTRDEQWEYTLAPGATVEMVIYASDNHIGSSFKLASSDPAVLAVPADSIDIVGSETTFDVTVRGPGFASIAILDDEDSELSSWGITIQASIVLPAFSFTKIDGKSTLVFPSGTLPGGFGLASTGDLVSGTWAPMAEGTDYSIDSDGNLLIPASDPIRFIRLQAAE